MTSAGDDSLADLMAAARLLDVPIAAEWGAGVAVHLAVSLQFAALLAAFPLPDDTEPAPVFVA